ncbi:MAG: sigma-70 family RNA polymerase sigma factor [Luteitalea sp.]|nr:sigma-70 family RNA polymerase sigma factor [Luteitalea sp.]
MRRDERDAEPSTEVPIERRQAVDRSTADAHGEFEAIVRTYERRVYNLACQVLGDREEARDAVQEIFLRVHQHLESFRFEAKFSTWLYRLAMNHLLNYRRRWWRMRFERLKEQTVGRREPVFTGPEPEQHLLDQEEAEAVRRAIAKLPVKLRATLVLKDLQGLSYADISDVLGVTEGTVASRLNAARSQLARRLRHLRPSHEMK